MIQWFCDSDFIRWKYFHRCENKKFLPTAAVFIYHIFSCHSAGDVLPTMCICFLTCPRAVGYQSAGVVGSALPMLLPPVPSHCCWMCLNFRMGIISGGERGETPGTADTSPCSTWMQPSLWWKLWPCCYLSLLECLLSFISVYFFVWGHLSFCHWFGFVDQLWILKGSGEATAGTGWWVLVLPPAPF